MENLYQSKYQQIDFDSNTGIMQNTWISESVYMTADEYKSNLEKLVNLIAQHQATKQLVNTLNFEFTIDIELQDWTDEHVNKKNREAGVRKVAFVIAEEIFSQMSIEQAMEPNEGSKMDVRYFTTPQEAQSWLLE
ncbi:MAG TPA: hypothetical protein DCS93_07610 [Microscillaceae bacterium]|nr:hypothetical protein [Microscillaceae bacterium]